MTEMTLAESLAARGLSEPEKREELADLLCDANNALGHEADRLTTALCVALEGYSDGPLIGPTEVAFAEATNEFDRATTAVISFLLDNGRRVEDMSEEVAA